LAAAAALSAALPVTVDPETHSSAGGAILAVAQEYALTTYDAAYLELTMRRRAALFSLDGLLRKAAAQAGTAVFPQ
jgi:predicted nucleic acid-binding protein